MRTLNLFFLVIFVLTSTPSCSKDENLKDGDPCYCPGPADKPGYWYTGVTKSGGCDCLNGTLVYLGTSGPNQNPPVNPVNPGVTWKIGKAYIFRDLDKKPEAQAGYQNFVYPGKEKTPVEPERCDVNQFGGQNWDMEDGKYLRQYQIEKIYICITDGLDGTLPTFRAAYAGILRQGLNGFNLNHDETVMWSYSEIRFDAYVDGSRFTFTEIPVRLDYVEHPCIVVQGEGITTNITVSDPELVIPIGYE